VSIATALVALDTQRDNLAANLTTMGVTASSGETLFQLVPKVLDIPTTDLVPILKLDGLDNTGSGHDSEATTWKDLSGTVPDATLSAGSISWGSNYLRLNGSSYWNVNAPNYSRGTVEVVVSIDTDFVPVVTSLWYDCSAIFGREVSGTQQDFGVLINSSGKFAVGYSTSTIWSSTVNALDGLPHTLSFTYYRGPVRFAIDGIGVANFTTVCSGTEMTGYGIGWQGESSATKIKGNIYSVKWFNELLTSAQIANNHAANKEYYVF